MIEVKTIPSYNLTVDETRAIGKMYFNLFQDFDVATHHLENYVNPFNTAWTDYDAVSKPSGASVITKEIRDYDQDRDYDFLIFRSYVEHLRYVQRGAESRSLDELELLIQTYGYSLQAFGYIKQSSAMDGLLKDLRTKEKAIEAITEFQLEEKVAAMEASQQKFMDAYVQKYEEKAEKAAVGSAIELRKVLLEKMMKLLTGLEIAANMFMSEEIKDLVQNINAINEDFSARIQSRETRNEIGAS
ncbi:DUF6261 family protein [Sediminitomix flava]|uniref:Uncharacterized protein n=1 Tax=Sediminitomix flava TaxID=379075 RepID=A0A315Z5S6_SEDFL|nr:DUF6261 family protein [Sediminitomix flava]PWJ38496.1 hypothetical protein BC781_10786 [Sediminitomix flava]